MEKFGKSQPVTRREDIPANVTINEVVELAKRYSTAASGAFVNGILDRIKTRAQGSATKD